MTKKMRIVLGSVVTMMLSTISINASAETATSAAANTNSPRAHNGGHSLHQQWCARCHGSIKGDGLIGPNLSKSVTNLSREEFTDIVTHGKKSDAGRMPGWKSNPRIMSGINQLYDFLEANSTH